MNKTIRNKALRSVNRLITATYHGDDWCAPDYFAIKANVYEGYKMLKSQREPYLTHKPILDSIIDRDTDYVPATVDMSTPIDDDHLYTTAIAGEHEFKLDKRYVALFETVYAGCEYQVSPGFKYAPVRVLQNNELVGVIMPVKA